MAQEDLNPGALRRKSSKSPTHSTEFNLSSTVYPMGIQLGRGIKKFGTIGSSSRGLDSGVQPYQASPHRQITRSLEESAIKSTFSICVCVCFLHPRGVPVVLLTTVKYLTRPYDYIRY